MMLHIFFAGRYLCVFGIVCESNSKWHWHEELRFFCSLHWLARCRQFNVARAHAHTFAHNPKFIIYLCGRSTLLLFIFQRYFYNNPVRQRALMLKSLQISAQFFVNSAANSISVLFFCRFTRHFSFALIYFYRFQYDFVVAAATILVFVKFIIPKCSTLVIYILFYHFIWFLRLSFYIFSMLLLFSVNMRSALFSGCCLWMNSHIFCSVVCHSVFNKQHRKSYASTLCICILHSAHRTDTKESQKFQHCTFEFKI